MAEPHSFGRYRVTGTLGSGAMGEVFAATDDVLGREVAIKTLRAGANASAFLDERFRQEARAIASLAHPGVVQVFDIDVAAEPPYLVMERVAGPSLKERLADGPLPPDEVRALGIQIARALAAAHAAGIVHRDVKPANILAAGAGRWKLADFGVAHVPDSSLTMTGQFVGSPAYAAPEALVAGKTGPASDVFGLGATLYEAAAGSWPRTGASTALLAPAPPLRERAPAIPPEIASAIDHAIAIEADRRPSAGELAELLSGTVAAPKARRSHWQFWAIVSAIAVAIVVIGLATRGGGKSDAKPAPAANAPELAPDDPRTPDELDEKRAKEWNKIVDELHRGHLEGARKKLDDWERKFGPSDESANLRAQLDAVLPGDPSRPDRSGDAMRDWEHIIEEARRGHIEPARHKLDEWESRYGVTPESAQLRSQLESIAPRRQPRDD